MSVLSLAAAKKHLNVTDGTQDGEVQDTIDAAEAYIADVCGPLAPVQVTDRLPGYADQLILRTTPPISLTSVTAVGGSALTLTDLWLDTDAGLVEHADGFTPFTSRLYVVVYQAGRTEVPDGLLQAIKELVKALWRSQRGSGTRPGGGQLPAGFQVPPVVEQLLEPHRVVKS